ncbi:MAG: hypothetical protein GYA87_09325 [Christensenellaceae bacterium]|nr:hypothetical protein [Christensenellaceae bacterium]
MNNFKNNIDKELYNIQWKGNNQVFDEIYGKKTKKSFKLKPVILIGIIVVVILGTALALNFNYSKEYNMVKDAKQAIMLKYNFSPEIMDSFSPKHISNKDGEKVEFENFVYENEKTGKYTVTFKDNKVYEVSWSNDHIDPKEYSGGNLDAPAWGFAQLEKMRKIKKDFREKYDTIDWSDSNNWTLEQKAEMDKDFTHETLAKINVLPDADDIQPDKAIEIAKQALIDKYGFKESFFDNLSPFIDFYSVSFDNGKNTHKEYDINFAQKIDDNSYDSKLYTAISSPDGKVKNCTWTVEAQDLHLPDGDLIKYESFVKEYFEKGAFEFRNATEKADIAQRLKAAGFEYLLQGVDYVSPKADIANEDVIKAANKALFDKFGGDESVLNFFNITKGFVNIKGQKQWQVSYIEKESYSIVNYYDMLGDYTVSLTEDTLEPIDVTWSLGLSPMQADENSWGMLDKYSLNILPYLKTTLNNVKSYLDKYEENTYPEQMSTEDAAAFSKLYLDAGFSKYDHSFVSYTLPDENDIPETEIRKKAQEVLIAEKQVTNNYFDTATCYVQCYYDYINGKGEKVWSVRYYGQDEMYNVYFLIFDARTGDLLELHHEDSTMGNG